MKRLLAAAGLAALVCLALVLSACTDGTSLDDPLLESKTVDGLVSYRSGEPVSGAKVIIYYWDGDSWELAKDGGAFPWVLTNGSGYYVVYYKDEARYQSGKVTAEKGSEFGVTDGWTYPNGSHTTQDIDIE